MKVLFGCFSNPSIVKIPLSSATALRSFHGVRLAVPIPSVFDNPEPAVATREIANNLTAIAEGILAHPTGGAFACALATDCGQSALVTNSDETARHSHAEPPGASRRRRLTLAPTRRRPCVVKPPTSPAPLCHLSVDP